MITRSVGLAMVLALVTSDSFGRSVTQTLTFSEISGFPDYSDLHLEPNDWDSPFPFNSPQQIRAVMLDFATTDPDFNTGMGPGGGESGVVVRLSHALSSVVPGNQNLGYDPTVQPSFSVLAEMLADGDMDMELHGFENFPVAGYSQALELNEMSSLSITVSGVLGSVTQVRQLAEIPGDFSADGRLSFDANGWNSAFPFSHASDIQFIEIDFVTTDADFNSATGPNGGDPGVGIQVVEDLASVEPGDQSIVIDTTVLPLYTVVAAMLADGATKVGLAGFEGFPAFSSPLALDNASTLTVTILGIPEPSSAILTGIVAAVLVPRPLRQEKTGRLLLKGS